MFIISNRHRRKNDRTQSNPTGIVGFSWYFQNKYWQSDLGLWISMLMKYNKYQDLYLTDSSLWTEWYVDVFSIMHSKNIFQSLAFSIRNVYQNFDNKKSALAQVLAFCLHARRHHFNRRCPISLWYTCITKPHESTHIPVAPFTNMV